MLTRAFSLPFRHPLFAALLLTLSLSASPQLWARRPENPTKLYDAMQKKLTAAKTPADSLPLLVDMLDLTDSLNVEIRIGELTYEAALRAKNSRIGLDALRNLGTKTARSDSLMHKYIEAAQMFPPSEDRSETITFLRIMHNQKQVNLSSPEERQKILRELLNEIANEYPENIYDRIVLTHAVVCYMATFTKGAILNRYLNRLNELVDQLRPEATPLRDIYLTQAAILTHEAELPEQAVEADKLLLADIEALETGKIGLNRRYRDYDPNKFLVYTRLLTNYKALTPQEIESYYARINEISQRNGRVRLTREKSLRADIVYAFYHKDYPKALEMMKRVIDTPYNLTRRHTILKMMNEAATAVGDKETQLYAATEYAKAIEEVLRERTTEKTKELQILYDISELRADYQHRRSELQRTLMIVSLAAALVFLIFAIVLWRLLHHSRQLAVSLTRSNATLTEESASLRKTQTELLAARDEARKANQLKDDFIRNMSNEVMLPLHAINEYANMIVDCVDAEDKSYLHHFAELVEMNSQLLSTSVKDVIALSEVDGNSLRVEMRPEEVEQMCQNAVDSFNVRLSEGVSLRLLPPPPGEKDLSIVTDSRRVVQILNQLLSNAAKFTTKGTIELGYSLTDNGKKVRIAVTDTGCGVPPSQSRHIFDRFVKLDKNARGAGIGLTLARSLAKLLGGTLELDPLYSPGARFVLTLPVK